MGRPPKIKEDSPTVTGKITEAQLGPFATEQMQRYGSYVVMERAVADVRDGMKPVQRRILWSMHDLQLMPGTNFGKCAKVVGHVMGNFHAHSDQAIYGTLVNMVHDRYPLIEGHGNFGGPTDDYASFRYTESRLTTLALTLLKDKDVATYIPNYSGDRVEPLVLPSRAPMTLLNGSSGIGVGMSACIPPHNLREVVSALIFMVKNPDCRFSTLLHYIHGPDYNTGILTSSEDDVRSLYENGKGVLTYRCRYHYEDSDDGSTFLVLTQLAPNFNLIKFLERMKSLQDQNLINYCSDVSSSEGMRILISFSDVSALAERVIPELSTSINYQFYVVKRNESEKLSPETLLFCTLRDLLQEFIDFRKIIEELRLKNELVQETESLAKAEAILLGIQNVDKIYTVLQNRTLNKTDLITKELATVLQCTTEQAGIILQMKVLQLAKMNEEDQKAKIRDILETIGGINEDLQNIPKVIVKHLQELLAFADDRGTTLRDEVPALKEEEVSSASGFQKCLFLRYVS